MDISGSCIPSSKFSVNGSGYEDESFLVFDYIHFIYFCTPCFSFSFLGPLVSWSCFSFGWEETRDLNHCSKLCGKFNIGIGIGNSIPVLRLWNWLIT